MRNGYSINVLHHLGVEVQSETEFDRYITCSIIWFSSLAAVSSLLEDFLFLIFVLCLITVFLLTFIY
jgi:membrane-anchored protein YejM (alkaline phosphatase superfamily)